MKKRNLGRAAAGALLALTLGPVGLSTAAAQADDTSFYDTPSTLPAANGDIVRAEPSQFYIDPVKLIEAAARVQRIMYRSTDRTGDPIAVTGTVLTPHTAWNGRGERPLVAYAVGTQGLGDDCAPSRTLGEGLEYEGPAIAGLLARGYSVVVTDYEGLGTEDLHTYMMRESQAHTVLDSIRAAQRLPGSGASPTSPVAITGYSQGGGAAAAAAELASSYAPEIDLKGVALGAPPADLAAVAENLDGSLYVAFMGYAVAAVSESYDVDLDDYLNPRGQQMLATLEEQCTVESVATFPFVKSADLTVDGKPLTGLLGTEPFSTMVGEQRIGDGRSPEVPVLITHSRLDDVIPFHVGKELAGRWCEQGARVQFLGNVAPTHIGGYLASYPAHFAFLEARFAGHWSVNSCWRL